MPEAWLETSWNTYRWMIGGARTMRAPCRFRPRLLWRSIWTSANWRLSRAILEKAHGRAVLEIEDPILIVGPWRSGTTVMHERLASVTGLGVPQTWQCMNAASFVVRGRPPTDHAVQRPMDEQWVCARSGQEDEFALLTLGIRSAYGAFMMPNRLEELGVTLEQRYWLADAAWQDVWLTFLRAVLYTLPEARQPLILKSPNHTFRLQAILRRFARLRLVWMVRDPHDLFQSNLNMWRAMCARYGLVRAADSQLEGFIARVLANAARTLDWCAAELAPSQMVMVPVEDLRANPEKVLRAVCDRLGLSARSAPEKQAATRGATLAARVAGRGDLAPTAQAAIATLRRATHAAAPKFGLRL